MSTHQLVRNPPPSVGVSLKSQFDNFLSVVQFFSSDFNFSLVLSFWTLITFFTIFLIFLSSISVELFKRKTGARGLRAILENIMLDIMFDLPSYKDKKLTIDYIKGSFKTIVN